VSKKKKSQKWLGSPFDFDQKGCRRAGDFGKKPVAQPATYFAMFI
jgi:hypothetical protein